MNDARAGMRSCPQPERASGRWLRAAAFTSLSMVSAAAAHPLASGDPVPWQRLAAGAVCVPSSSWLAAAKSRPRWQVATATGIAQLVLHRALSVQQPRDHGHAEAHGSVSHIVRTAHSGTWVMATAHCAAACVMALLMCRADQVLSRLPETVGRWAQRAVATAAAAFGALRRPHPWSYARTGPVPLDGPDVRSAAARMLCDAVVRRGPPVRCAQDVPLIPAG
ncbi:hypothetical protein ACFWFZ_25860 [Streptomyces sp. NPDC060232]|uniref:hypothetical protein n=1 Tax=Streptomyces sp. NPDC060232 TaxID=3347079 RepID=UPI003663C163